MDKRMSKGAHRPRLDIFGNAYAQSVSFRHIGDGYHVAVPAFADPVAVRNAIQEITDWLANQHTHEEIVIDEESSIESASDSPFSV